MMLVEEGELRLDDPVSKYLNRTLVLVERTTEVNRRSYRYQVQCKFGTILLRVVYERAVRSDAGSCQKEAAKAMVAGENRTVWKQQQQPRG